MKKMEAMMLVAAVALTGCGVDENPKEVVQSVEWFKEHPAEREAQLAKCKSNPGELAATPNCVNASRADSSTTWSSRGGTIKVAPLESPSSPQSVKPEESNN